VGRTGDHCPNVDLVLDLDRVVDVVQVAEGASRGWSRSTSRSRTRPPSLGAWLVC